MAVTLLHAHDVPDGLGWLGPAERALVSRFRFPKRRRDWLLGRAVAKRALAGWSPTLAGAEILPAPDGSPTIHLPGGGRSPVAISLSHRAGYGACAVAPAGRPIGIDLERVEPRSSRMLADFFTPAEQRAVATSVEPALAANLIWSAKESVLKALKVGLRRDTRTVEIALAAGAFTATDATTGHRFTGWWRRHADLVLTGVGPAPAQPIRWPPVPGQAPAPPGPLPKPHR